MLAPVEEFDDITLKIRPFGSRIFFVESRLFLIVRRFVVRQVRRRKFVCPTVNPKKRRGMLRIIIESLNHRIIELLNRQ